MGRKRIENEVIEVGGEETQTTTDTELEPGTKKVIRNTQEEFFEPHSSGNGSISKIEKTPSSTIDILQDQIKIAKAQTELKMTEKIKKDIENESRPLQVPASYNQDDRIYKELEKTQKTIDALLQAQRDERIKELEKKLDEALKRPQEIKKSIWDNPDTITAITTAVTTLLAFFQENSKRSSEQMQNWIKLTQQNQKDHIEALLGKVSPQVEGRISSMETVLPFVRDIIEITSGKPVDEEGQDGLGRVLGQAERIMKMFTSPKEQALSPEQAQIQRQAQSQEIAQEAMREANRLLGNSNQPVQQPVSTPNISQTPSLEGVRNMSQSQIVQNTIQLLIVDLINKPKRSKWAEYAYDNLPEDVLTKILAVQSPIEVISIIKPYLTPDLEKSLTSLFNPLLSPLEAPRNIQYLIEGINLMKLYAKEDLEGEGNTNTPVQAQSGDIATTPMTQEDAEEEEEEV